MVHIFPYWGFNKGQMIDVRVCSNAPRVELQLNGKTIGTHDIDHKEGKELVGWWKVPYEEGELKAIAYDEKGNVIATDLRRSFGDPEMKAVNLGTAYKDPYGFISAGLYDYSKGEVGNGNERGVATARDGETQVGFHNIDFGPYGSDIITIPIFALSSAEYSLQIWEGMPYEEGSELFEQVLLR